MIILALTIFVLINIAGVSAADANDTVIASDDMGEIDLSSNSIETDDLKTSPEDTPLSQANNDEIASVENDSEVLNVNPGTYSGLASEIGSGGNIKLLHDYYTYDNYGSTISISDANSVIDGNGAVIDMAGSTIRAFILNAPYVIIKNLTIKNVNFDGNGGAIYFSGSGTVENCNFIDNKATGGESCGGVVYFASNGNVDSCNFTNNSAWCGGAVYFINNGEVKNSNFSNNKASKRGGGVYSQNGKVNVIKSTFIKNTASDRGGGVYLNRDGEVTNCNFVNNFATNRGGAVYSENSNVNVIKSTFIKNTASVRGGAIYFYSYGEVTNCNFTNNKATGSDSDGGAIYFMYKGEVTNCNFVNNYASIKAGAVYFHDKIAKVINCNFINNSASTKGGGVYFNMNSEVKKCNFINNSAESGNAIYYKKCDGNIENSIFINTNKNTVIVETGENIMAINSWFGNDATNYNVKPQAGNVKMDNWLFLNATANPDAIAVFTSSDIIFKLFTFTVSSQNPSDYDNTCLTPVNLTLSSTNGNLNASSVKLGEPVKYTANSIGTGSATASIENIAYTIKLKNVKGDPVLSAEGQIITYGQNATITLNYNSVATGKVNITLTGKKCTITYTNLGLNTTVILPDDIAADEYNVTVVYSGDDTFLNATANTTLTINKADSTLTVDNVVLDYGESVNVTVTAEGAEGITAKIDNDDAVVNGNIIVIPSLDVGNYTLTVTTIADANHNNVTKTANITVNKIDSTLTVDNVVLDYGESVNVTVTAEGAEGITAKIGSDNVTVNGYTIPISGLNASIYNLTVTTVPDSNHNPVNKTVTITVNKVNSTLTVDNVVLDYGKTTNVTAITEGATGVTAKINNDDAVVNGNTIVIPSLDVGNYTLTVTTIADANHNNITKTATITVNKVNATLTVDDVVLDYGETKNVAVIVDGASAITAKIGESAVNVTGFVISIPALDAGTYILTVTAIADKNHNNITKNATITVNKLKTELTGNAITTTYNVNKDLVITLKDSTGKALSGVKVTVDLNGAKTYTTDKNGQVKVSTKGIAPKAYTAKVTFNGNTNYDKSTKDIKVTVKKATPKLTAKKKTFKTTPKTKKYTIVLKDNTGKAIKKAKVTLKVKGKTYKATTNSKGKATFKITKLNKKGTFKATITYKGNKYYNKVSKKAKIKVIVTFKTVSKGSKDKATVKEIQQALKDKGYYLTYQGHYLKVDGKFKGCTERSLKEFQKDNGLKVTGKVDEKTAKKLGIL